MPRQPAARASSPTAGCCLISSTTQGYPAGKVGIYTGLTAAFEHFLVREWPGGVLAPRRMYRAELQAGFVLLDEVLSNGWIDVARDWDELSRENNQFAGIGREEWDDLRVEANVAPGEHGAGVLARFAGRADGTFGCYLPLLNTRRVDAQAGALEGSYTGETIDEIQRTELWSCSGDGCAIDWAAAEHALALTCEGNDLLVEVDGATLARVSDDDPLTTGKAALFFTGTQPGGFGDLVVRSAPRLPVYGWSFVTSAFAGLVELLDPFAGQVYAEPSAALAQADLADAVTAVLSELQATAGELDSARQALVAASDEELDTLRTAAQLAAQEHNRSTCASTPRRSPSCSTALAVPALIDRVACSASVRAPVRSRAARYRDSEDVDVFRLLTHGAGIGADADEEAARAATRICDQQAQLLGCSEAADFCRSSLTATHTSRRAGCRCCNCSSVLRGLTVSKGTHPADYARERVCAAGRHAALRF